jgi:hypothetical protein
LASPRPFNSELVLVERISDAELRGYLQGNLAILLDYDVPVTALRKLAGVVPADLSLEKVFSVIGTLMPAHAHKFDEYELAKLKEALASSGADLVPAQVAFPFSI